MKKLIVSLILPAALLQLSSSAVAQVGSVEVIYDDDQVQSTLISGDVGPDQTIKHPGHDAFLYGIGFGEVYDDPCYLKLYWWRFNASYSDRRQGDFTTEFDICPDGPRAYADKFLVLDNFSQDNLRAIHAIKIGVNGNNGKLKGAKIYGSYINRFGAGAVEREPALQEEFERPNLNTWETKRACDDGEVAVGVIVEYDDSWPAIVGLGLDCAVPEVWTVMSSAVRPPDL